MSGRGNGNIESFGRLFCVTGLEVNKGRTQLMVTGGENWGIGGSVEGIRIVETVTLLGIKIDRKSENLDHNWVDKINNMRYLCAYWNNFGLSINGRVMVAKTYILSQCIYLMGILPLRKQLGDVINDILITYVSGRDRPIERRRQLLTSSLGGYGLFDINDMCMCIKSMWIQRWTTANFNPDTVPAAILSANERSFFVYDDRQLRGNVIVRDILLNWKLFKEKYFRYCYGVLDARFFIEEVMGEGGNTICESVFQDNRRIALMGQLKLICTKDVVTVNGSCVTKEAVETLLTSRITWVEYFRIRQEVRRVMTDYVVKWDLTDTRVKLEDFVNKTSKGCKRYRNILTGRYTEQYEQNSPSMVRAGATLWAGFHGDMSRELLERNYSFWTDSRLEAGFKDFTFRLVHGKLYLNYQRANFEDINRGCTFCEMVKHRELTDRGLNIEDMEYQAEIVRVPREDTTHLFWECGKSSTLINGMVQSLLGQQWGRRIVVNKRKFMGGWEGASKRDTNVTLFIVHFIKYFIFKCKQRR